MRAVSFMLIGYCIYQSGITSNYLAACGWGVALLYATALTITQWKLEDSNERYG